MLEGAFTSNRHQSINHRGLSAFLSFCSSSPALYAKQERREECERVDDAPPTYAEGAGRGDGGNEQIHVRQGFHAII